MWHAGVTLAEAEDGADEGGLGVQHVCVDLLLHALQLPIHGHGGITAGALLCDDGDGDDGDEA
jgi:hypothetical protein